MIGNKKGWRKSLPWLMVGLLWITTACGSAASTTNTTDEAGNTSALKDVKVVLDWTPNTNHTGLYVAQAQGFYKEAGLNVEIIAPGQGGADTMVASGEVPFGISYQESVTQARVQGVPLVSLAAVIQHNTSGFAAPTDRGIKTPKDMEGKSYGAWGSPVEEAVMKSIMDTDGGDVSKVKSVNIGNADYFTAVQKGIDFAWIFYAWTGIEAELRGQPLDMLYVKDYSDQLDYYTPVIVTNEKQISTDPELVKSFMAATSKGYEYAIAHPDESADILLKAVPDLDPKLVKASQEWLSPRYQDDAPRWGEQKQSVWEGYANWMFKQKLLDSPLDATKAYTNDYLPAATTK
ncbi:ABC transporter substrate-binding protein [Paenibacillus nuruki]|uniref:ABC transporter substrate-binding protein n=1 Tax=Paenibacillus nuruki TaxID=1886670 RepID=UPI0028062727|nr:ABC transporter substrate-binding protein [Paenibacillus nuruki]CAJ1316957.1 Formylaminopyrimidine-binding protein [Paenibacillus nuruki]